MESQMTDAITTAKDLWDFVNAMKDAYELAHLGFSSGRTMIAGPATARLEAAYAKSRAIWELEGQRGLPAVLERLAAHDAVLGDVRAQLSEMVGDDQFVRLVGSYTRQASQEPLDERVRMFAHAVAGSFDLGLNIGEKARVERVLRELDPADVILLSRIHRAAGSVWWEAGLGEDFGSTERLRHRLWQSSPKGEALAASYCVRTEVMRGAGTAGTPTIVVTETGRLVLRVLRSFVAARPAAFDAPGREVDEASRSREQAHALLDAVGVRSAVVDFCLRNRVTPSYSCARAKKVDAIFSLPAGSTATRINFLPVDTAAAEALTSIAPKGEISIHSARTDMDNAFSNLWIEGTHDVLRWLADDLEAPWW